MEPIKTIEIDESARMEKIFRQRAERLALRPLGENAFGATLSVLTFYLGKERYGIEMTSLTAVTALSQISPLPGSRSEVVGVIPWRGKIRTVVSLTRLLGLAPDEKSTEESEYTLLLMRRQSGEIGLKVGSVDSIESIDPVRLTPNASANYIKGFIPNQFILLDPEILLSHSISEKNKNYGGTSNE